MLLMPVSFTCLEDIIIHFIQGKFAATRVNARRRLRACPQCSGMDVVMVKDAGRVYQML